MICPKCGSHDSMECIDVFDSSCYGDVVIINYCYGRCTRCGTGYKWEDRYELVGSFENFEEDI